MRRVVIAAFLAVTLCACEAGESSPPGAVSGGGGASCVGPYINTSAPDDPDGTYLSPPVTVEPGQAITVYGHWYTSTCNDGPVKNPLEPLDDVTLVVTLPGQERVPLGPFTPAGYDMGFSARVTVPADTPAGPAVVFDPEMGRSEGYRFVVGAG